MSLPPKFAGVVEVVLAGKNPGVALRVIERFGLANPGSTNEDIVAAARTRAAERIKRARLAKKAPAEQAPAGGDATKQEVASSEFDASIALSDQLRVIGKEVDTHRVATLRIATTARSYLIPEGGIIGDAKSGYTVNEEALSRAIAARGIFKDRPEHAQVAGAVKEYAKALRDKTLNNFVEVSGVTRRDFVVTVAGKRYAVFAQQAHSLGPKRSDLEAVAANYESIATSHRSVAGK